MIKLNLLPAKVRAAELMRLVVLVGVAVYAFFLLILAWRWVAAHSKVSAMERARDEVRAQLNAPELTEAVQAVERFTKDEKEKNDKASIVNALRKKQVALVNLMDQVPDWVFDGQVWFTDFNVAWNGAERRVTIDGQAM